MNGRIIWWHELPRTDDFARNMIPERKGWANGGKIIFPYDAEVEILNEDDESTTIFYKDAKYNLNRMLVCNYPTAQAGDLITFKSPVIMVPRPIIQPTDYDFRWIYSNRLRIDVCDHVFLVVKEKEGWLLLSNGSWVTKSAAWVCEKVE